MISRFKRIVLEAGWNRELDKSNNAIEAEKSGKISLDDVCEEYGIPRDMLTYFIAKHKVLQKTPLEYHHVKPSASYPVEDVTYIKRSDIEYIIRGSVSQQLIGWNFKGYIFIPPEIKTIVKVWKWLKNKIKFTSLYYTSFEIFVWGATERKGTAYTTLGIGNNRQTQQTVIRLTDDQRYIDHQKDYTRLT